VQAAVARINPRLRQLTIDRRPAVT